MSDIGIIVKELALFVCIDERCGYAVEVDAIARHLRTVHGMDKDAARKRACEVGLELKASEGQSVEQARDKYHVGNMDATFECPLPAIRGLPVKECVKCANCSFVTSTAALLRRKHVCGVGSESGGGGALPLPCKAQSIYGGNKTRYFEVFTDGVANPILNAMRKVEGDVESGPQVDVSRMDGLLAELRFDKTLERFKLDMKSAVDLAKWRDCELHKALREVCCRYLQRAFKESMERPYIQTHRFMDGKLKLALLNETQSRYEVRVSRFVSFIVCAKDLCAGEGTKSSALCGPALCADVEALVKSLGGDPDKSLAALHRVLLCVLFGEMGVEQEVVPLYIACVSVYADSRGVNFRYGTASNTSPHLASLKYLGKCVVVFDVYILTEANRTERLKEVLKGTEEDMDTGLTYAEHCLKTAHSIHIAEGGYVRFVVCNRHAQCGIVDGHELSLRMLGEKMRQLQMQAWDLLRNKLLFGLHVLEPFFKRCTKIQDNLLEPRSGYWIGSNPGAGPLCEEWKESMASRGATALLAEDGTLKTGEAFAYLGACEELLKTFSVLMQVCSGGPARVTEAAVLQVFNTSEAFRNLFVIGGELLYITRYCKSRSLRQGAGKVVVRFPDAETSKLLLTYLLIIRPFENAIVEMLGEGGLIEGNGARHRTFLYASRGEGVTADQLRRWFEGSMRNVGIPLATNQYRHFYTGAVKNFLGMKGSGEEDEGNMFHEQAAHSSSTAHRIYGVSTGDVKGITGDEMDAFRRSSKLWTRALGLEDSHELQGSTVKDTPDSGVADYEGMKRFQEGVEKRLGRIERMLADVLGAVKQLPTGGASGKRSLQEAGPLGREGGNKVPRTDVGDLVGTLQVMLNSPTAKFKSALQEAAVKLCVNKTKDAMIILGTGEGKSLCFMLPGFAMPKHVSIVIVPLRALQVDLIRRCQEHGIQAALWEDRETACARLVFASAEHVMTPEYTNFAREKHTLGKLYAIFIDEAHIVVTAEDYREVMKHFRRKVRPSGVEVPIFALTASAPPEITEEIATGCGMKKNLSKLRGSTARGNIRYRVQHVSEHAMPAQLLATLKHLIRNMQHTEHVIIYVQTRVACEQVHELLQQRILHATAFKYHAGMDVSERVDSQCGWTNVAAGAVNCMVATNAFGCGIDVGSVRVVVHYGRPSGILEFSQESGRAGRDGQEAWSVVLDSGRRCNGGRQFGDIMEYVDRQDGCRRAALDLYNDGYSDVGDCAKRGMVLCDLCERQEKTNAGLAEVRPASLVSPRRALSTQQEKGDTGLAQLLPVSLASPPRGVAMQSPQGWPRSKSYGECPPEQLKEICTNARTMCPVCCMQEHRTIRHGPKNTACYKTRCLKCALPGHDAKDCFLLNHQGDRTCYQCSIGYYKRTNVHEPGTYGTRDCGVQKMMCMAFLAWQDARVRERMCQDIPELRDMSSQTYHQWLSGRSEIRGVDGTVVTGLGIVAPWIQEHVLERRGEPNMY